MNESSAEIEIPTQHATSDEQLARRVQEGCANSFTQLAQRLQPRLMLVLQRRLGNQTDAEDVLQRTLLRAFEKIQLYDPAKKFSPWLFTIALRTATDYQRKKKLPTTDAEPALTVVDPKPSPAEMAVEREQNADMWSVAKDVLKPDQWTALWLLYGEGHSVREVARSLNRSTVSVRVLLHRARKKLTPHLAKFALSQAPELTERSEEPNAQNPTLQVARIES